MPDFVLDVWRALAYLILTTIFWNAYYLLITHFTTEVEKISNLPQIMQLISDWLKTRP